MTTTGTLFRLGAGELASLIDDAAIAKTGRSARLLIQNEGLRITLITLGPGGVLPEHHARGPISVHVVSGSLVFRTEEAEWALAAGDLLTLGAGIPHSVSSEAGGTFVLTIALPA